MGLKYNASGRTYDLGGPQYTNVGGGSKRLNYIASGKTYQLGLATDSTCSQYSPLVMRINGTNHYIGRSTSESYTTSNSRSSTRLNTRTSSGYSRQSYTYGGGYIYTNIRETTGAGYFWGTYNSVSYTSTTGPKTEQKSIQVYNSYNFDQGHEVYTYITYRTRSASSSQQTLTSTSNAYYTTTMTNVANTTVSTSKSVSTSSHNFV